jgi:hypothetical protein
LLVQGAWLPGFLVLTIMLITAAPILMRDRLPVRMTAEFQVLAILCARLFAVAVGAVWEIFDFSMDEPFGTDMQKAMFGDPSGLTDTMWDLIVAPPHRRTDRSPLPHCQRCRHSFRSESTRPGCCPAMSVVSPGSDWRS